MQASEYQERSRETIIYPLNIEVNFRMLQKLVGDLSFLCAVCGILKCHIRDGTELTKWLQTLDELPNNSFVSSEKAYPLLGLLSEIGEFAFEYEKMLSANDKTYYDRLKYELGDILWYIARILDVLDTDFEEVMAINIQKTANRFGDMK